MFLNNIRWVCVELKLHLYMHLCMYVYVRVYKYVGICVCKFFMLFFNVPFPSYICIWYLVFFAVSVNVVYWWLWKTWRVNFFASLWRSLASTDTCTYSYIHLLYICIHVYTTKPHILKFFWIKYRTVNSADSFNKDEARISWILSWM